MQNFDDKHPTRHWFEPSTSELWAETRQKLSHQDRLKAAADLNQVDRVSEPCQHFQTDRITYMDLDIKNCTFEVLLGMDTTGKTFV